MGMAREAVSSAVVAAAEALAPQIRAARDEIERERRLPEDLARAMSQAGLFRLYLPRTYGGEEVAPATFVAVIEELAKADASTAWCVAQGSGCSLAAAYLAPEVARVDERADVLRRSEALAVVER